MGRSQDRTGDSAWRRGGVPGAAGDRARARRLPFRSTVAPAATRIGVVDPQRILGETNAGKAKGPVASFAQNRRALIELEKRAAADGGRLRETGQRAPAPPRSVSEEQFRRRMAEYQQKVTDLNREVQDKQKDVLDGFRDKIAGTFGQRWPSG